MTCKCGHRDVDHGFIETPYSERGGCGACSCLKYDDVARFPSPPASSTSRFAAIEDEMSVGEWQRREPSPARSRFSMLSEELAGEAQLQRSEWQASAFLRYDENGLACKTCGAGAFTPTVVGVERVPGIACRGCPNRPVYRLPPDVRVKTNRYRCERCGSWSEVSMTLSEVNLYCDHGLSIHVREVEPTWMLPTHPLTREVARVLLDGREMSADDAVRTMEDAMPKVAAASFTFPLRRKR